MILPTQGLYEYWQQRCADMNGSENVYFILLQGNQINHEADRALTLTDWHLVPYSLPPFAASLLGDIVWAAYPLWALVSSIVRQQTISPVVLCQVM